MLTLLTIQDAVKLIEREQQTLDKHAGKVGRILRDGTPLGYIISSPYGDPELNVTEEAAKEILETLNDAGPDAVIYLVGILMEEKS
jgi:hypothetical protein